MTHVCDMADSKRVKHSKNKEKAKLKSLTRSMIDRKHPTQSLMRYKIIAAIQMTEWIIRTRIHTQMWIFTGMLFVGARCNIGEDQLEKLLRGKLKWLHNDTFEKMLALGVRREIAKRKC